MDRRFILLLLGACFVNATWAGWPGEARITQLAHDVQAIHASGQTRRVSIHATLAPGSTIRTGDDSRAEVTIGDEIAIRLAANTELRLNMKPGNFDLKKGAVLAQASKWARGAKISAGSAAAAIGGVTAMIEHHPGVCKFLVLEGMGRLYRPAHLGDSVLIGPGQMVIGNPDSPVSDPVDFDIARFVATSHFTVDLPALRSQPLIAAEIQKQRREKSEKTLIDTNLVIFGGGTLVSLVDPAQLKRPPAPKAQKEE
jgi:ferric-dicitrate binding protein FerR (iron transport regulator)